MFQVHGLARSTFPSTVEKLAETSSFWGVVMSGGRPPVGKQPRYAELEELASWFHLALTEAGYESVHAFLRDRGRYFEKNTLYAVFGARRLLPLGVTQSLALALNRNPDHVVAIWTRAKEARDRAVLASMRAEHRRIASWADLPVPSLALRNLLEAQSVAADRLPYELLGVQEPPLSSVYVLQPVRLDTGAARHDREGSASNDQALTDRESRSRQQTMVLSVRDALDRHDHLVITGEPGAGKSALSGYLTAQLSRIWLRDESSADAPLSEPVVPVRVPARYLDASGSWSSVLAEAIGRALGPSMVEDASPAIFTGRVQGARWLILVDALDEVPDPKARGDVIRCIAQHAHAGGAYRFVITTRELPEVELAPLLRNAGKCAMMPFERANLEEFTGKWFSCINAPSSGEVIERFLRETSDGRLRELVRNPLLATIAALSTVIEPDRPLPASRISLYERFCGYLSHDLTGNRDYISQMHRHYSDDPKRMEFVLWLYTNAAAIVSALARARMNGDDALWPVAVDWVKRNVPAGIALVESWEKHLNGTLARTGLLAAEGPDLRFLHQSFAEYLAAKACAETIGNEFAELDAWIRRGFKRAERTFVLFTLALWATLEGNDINVVMNQLLASRDPRRTLLAARLMAEGVAVPDAAGARIVDRLISLARNSPRGDWEVEAVEALGTLFDSADVIDRLEDLATDVNFEAAQRMEAVVALEHLSGREHAEQLMVDLLPSSYGEMLSKAGSVACRLGARAVGQVRQRTLEMVSEPDATRDDHVLAAEVMRDLGLPADTAAFAKTVLQEQSSEPSHLSRAAEAWFGAIDEPAVGEISELARARPEWDIAGRAALAAFFARIGVNDVASSLAKSVLDSETASSDAVEDAVTAIVATTGIAGIASALPAVDRWCNAAKSGRLDGSWSVGRMLKTIAQIGPDSEVIARIENLLNSQAVSMPGADDLVDAWLTAAGIESVASIMTLTERGAALEPFARGETALLLQKIGANAEAMELAENLLDSQIEVREVLAQAAEVVISIDETVGVALLTSLAGTDVRRPPTWFAAVMDALGNKGTTSLADAAQILMAERLVSHPRIESLELRDALAWLLLFAEDVSKVDFVANQTIDRRELQIGHRIDLAIGMAALGELSAAKVVWSNIFKWQEYSARTEINLIEAVVQAGEMEWAIGQIRALIADENVAALRRIRLRQMLGWLTAADDASNSR